MSKVTGLEALKISAQVMGKPGAIYPALIWDEHTAILVDAGYPGQLAQIREATEKAGVPLAKIRKIIITHHDLDHTGSLADILKELPGEAEVLAHEEERNYIQAFLPPVKMTMVESLLKTLPEGEGKEMRTFYEFLKSNYKKLKARVDRTLADGEELPYCGGITVIHTPGHTPGHICLYHRPSKTLISGDTLFVEEGQLVPAPPSANLDQQLAAKSLKKLTGYEIEKVICYHGGLYPYNARRRIAELAGAQ